MRLIFSLVFACFIITCFSCKSPVRQATTLPQAWYEGKAELTSYTLQQARYGEMREGEATLIFVKEDFSPKALVKLDEPDSSDEKVPVLKMNFVKKFTTGIYPYSMMLSVFTPLANEGNERAVKANCSSQEWCGHTFSELRLDGGKYNWSLNSYFEKEGIQNETFEGILLEDDIWAHIRINPDLLPQGKVQLLPGLLWQRLSHEPMKPVEATISITPADSFFIDQPGLQMCTINYPVAQRKLQIYFQPGGLHEIMGWQETYPDGFGNHKKMLTTSARKKQTMWLDYWNHNKNTDSTYRDSLSL